MFIDLDLSLVDKKSPADLPAGLLITIIG